jgi:signal transduction histidine kinase/CheY-like chemotaxis protein
MADVVQNLPSLAISAETRATLRQLQEETIGFALPGLYGLGLVLVAGAGSFADPLQGGLPGALLFLVPPLVWATRRINYLASAWSLVGGCLGVCLLVVLWSQLHVALLLLALPIGLAAVFVSLSAGMALAALCTALVWFLGTQGLSVPTPVPVASAVAMWGTLGLIWLLLHPLLTAVQWSQSSYARSNRLLEDARSYQLQLGQTLEDLAESNRQLTRLNTLAQGLRQAAEEARRVKEEFVANVSHELRTPLNMIIGFSEMILQAPEAYGDHIPAPLMADLAVILRNSQHLSKLTDDVLDLSQIEAGQMALTKERVALAELVENAAVAMRPLYASKGLYLHLEVPAELPLVFCDRTRICEVVLNLLSNAGRFTEHGGVQVRAWREKDDLTVSVVDTGPGITAEARDKLFQPFQQVDGSIRRRHGGSGLGLSISKSFVELHGGRMWLESGLAGGAAFRFSLPIDPPAPLTSSVTRWFSPYLQPKERERPPRASGITARPRFVIVETGSALRRLLTRYEENLELVPVRDLEAARSELAGTSAYGLLVNDVAVGDALNTLVGSAVLPYGIPAIVCSVPGVNGAADSLGVAGYMVKPVSRTALLNALEQLPLRGRTVLVVDDEPEVVRLFRRMLASAGREYRVLRAANGRQALSLLRRERPDVMLVDLMMPDMDGYQLLATKNGDPALRPIPVIVISARDPAGHDILSHALAVTRGGGLSVPQVLACIKALTGILSTTAKPGDPAPPESPLG